MGLRDEILFDVQTGPTLNPNEEKIVQLLTRGIVGGAILWATVNELVTEVESYRSRRERGRYERSVPGEPS